MASHHPGGNRERMNLCLNLVLFYFSVCLVKNRVQVANQCCKHKATPALWLRNKPWTDPAHLQGFRETSKSSMVSWKEDISKTELISHHSVCLLSPWTHIVTTARPFQLNAPQELTQLSTPTRLCSDWALRIPLTCSGSSDYTAG